MFKKILLAYNGSREGKSALLACAEIAAFAHSETHLLAVVARVGRKDAARPRALQHLRRADAGLSLRATRSASASHLTGRTLCSISCIRTPCSITFLIESIGIPPIRSRNWIPSTP